jgi:hypothetical protein
MDSACGHISFEPRLHALQNRTAVSVFPETEYFEKHCLLKCAENVRHKDYIVGIKWRVSTPFALVHF